MHLQFLGYVTLLRRILKYDDNVALDISCILEYQHEEEEVLILPYISLKTQVFSYLSSGLIEIEFEWYSYKADLEYTNEN